MQDVWTRSHLVLRKKWTKSTFSGQSSLFEPKNKWEMITVARRFNGINTVAHRFSPSSN